jgi:tight adherence protein C
MLASQLIWFLGVLMIICITLCLGGFSLKQMEPVAIACACVMTVLTALLIAFSSSLVWIEKKHKKLSSQIVRALPSFMDLIAVSLSAGLNLSAAFQFATQALADSGFKSWCAQILRDVETGQVFCQVLRDFSENIASPELDYFVACVLQSETLGTSLARQISDHADQIREEQYMHVEKQSMQAPVKMLLPLAVFIFPCNFLVLGFPIVSHLLNVN